MQDGQIYGDDGYQETQTNPEGFFADTKTAAACSVRVAVRVRPLIGRELYESPNICIQSYPESNQLTIGKDRAFTFDKVFDIETQQEEVFNSCVKNLVLGCFSGYNATVLAYGQTGSGKTFTMGSGYTIGLGDIDLGIIPRVIRLIFDEVEKRKNKAEFIIKCTFLEIYNEELNDLLDHGQINSNQQTSAVIDRFMQKKDIAIREEKNGNISVYGLKEEKVNCYEELAACLDKGSNFRSTASTLMNNSSSRSHAIFTISIEQHIIEDLYKPTSDQVQPSSQGEAAEEFMVAKFHFVDLAGSERAKRTGATGNTLKEGISINKGLLALGNVISALTEESNKKGHVPYRDSKLTRILQDSLGGNSRTSMIACVSPAEINFEETLNSLKYASRARNIKNKPIVNRDPNSQQVAQLRQQVYEISRELAACKKLLISNNIEFESLTSQLEGGAFSSDGYHGHSKEFAFGGQEIQRYEQEIKDLKIERSQKDKKMQQIQTQHDIFKDQLSQKEIECFQLQKERDTARFQLEQIVQVLKKRNIFNDILEEIHGYNINQRLQEMDIDENDKSAQKENYDYFFGSSGPCILEEYQVKVEEQKKDITEKDAKLQTLQTDFEILFKQSKQDIKMLEEKEKEIERLKRTVSKVQKENIQIKNDQRKATKGQPIPFATQAQRKAQITQHQLNGASDRNKQISPNIQPKKKNQPLQDASNNQWLSEELDYSIKHFNELFINNLSASLSNVLIKKNNQDSHRGGEDEKMHGDDHQATPKKEGDEQISSDDGDSSSESEHDDDEVIHDSQEVISNHEEAKLIDKEMTEEIKQQENQLGQLDGNIKDKEDLLEAIKQSHKLLQDNLLIAMKNEYHKKIQSLDQEIKGLEKEKAESLKKAETIQQKSKVEDTYKKKMKDLEDKLRDLKQKDKEQNQMSKEAEKQRTRIKQLQDEIDSIKIQKVSLQKQLNEQNKKHRIWKETTAKDLIKMRQANTKKDREIDKLKREYKKKDILAKRKQEELSALQKRNKLDKQKQINAEKDRNKKKNIDLDRIQDWIISNTEKMLKFKEYQQRLTYEKQEEQQIEYQIVEEQDQKAKLQVRREQLQLVKQNIQNDDEEEIYRINEEINEIDQEIKSIQDNVDSLEEKYDFVAQKVSNINSELISLSPDDIEKLNFSEVQSIEGARACLSTFFNILLDVNVHKKELQNKIQEQHAKLEDFKLQVDEASKAIYASEQAFFQDLEVAKQQHKEREQLLFRIIIENSGPDVAALIKDFSNADNQHTSNELIKDYLKQREQEQQVQIEPQVQPINNGQNKKNAIAKQEVKKNKEQQYNMSKMALSKRVAELERQNREADKKVESMKHKIDQSNQEKDHFKRQFEQIKIKIKTQEIQEIKFQKTSQNQEDQPNMGQKSPRLIHQQSLNPPNSIKLQTLNDLRAQRKMKRLESASGYQNAKQPNNEPKVIADEPMDDEVEMIFDQAENQDQITPELQLINQQNRQVSSKGEIRETSVNKDQETNVFTRLSQTQKGKNQVLANANLNTNFPTTHGSFSMPNQQLQIPVEQKINIGFDDDQKWRSLITKEQAHNNQVCALASVGNQLYSTSNKSLKIWDLDTMTCVSDIQAHNSFIKSMCIWEDKKLLLTASDKVIMLWDLISLTNVGTLKGHKDDIKTMTVSQDGNQLFSAGKGSQNGGALLIWDLRKGATPCEEREKNQDIFSLTSQGDYLFFGCRNHYVYPLNIRTYETVNPFEPPHFDAVTSLAILDNTLVSGSRDKNLRCWWDYSNLQNKQTEIFPAHLDWINCLETDSEKRELYSGSKDGIVKVWKVKSKKLKCMAQLTSNSSSINSICKIDKQFGKMFALGSSDKSIRMWKYKEKSPASMDSPDSGELGVEDMVLNQDALMDFNNDEDYEIENQLFQQLERKEEYKQEIQNKFQPVRQSVQHQNSMPTVVGGSSSLGVTSSNKYQQMRRQKRLQENQKRYQKENDMFQRPPTNN